MISNILYANLLMQEKARSDPFLAPKFSIFKLKYYFLAIYWKEDFWFINIV